jgi:hypothetical protein
LRGHGKAVRWVDTHSFLDVLFQAVPPSGEDLFKVGLFQLFYREERYGLNGVCRKSTGTVGDRAAGELDIPKVRYG